MNIPIFLYVAFIFIRLTKSLEYSPASQRLPSARNSLRAVYNGNDEVYLLGGVVYNGILDEVLQFSLSTEELQVVGRFPDGIFDGTAEFASGNVFYLGGYTYSGSYSSYIWGTSQTRLNPYPIGKLSESISSHTSVYDGENSIYIFGGIHDPNLSLSIQRFNINEDTTEVISTLPYGIFGSASIWFNNSAYIFGGISDLDPITTTVMKFTPSAQNELDVLPVQIPLEFSFGSVVTDGRFIYLVGGVSIENDTAIVVFDPATLNFTVENVTNLDGLMNGAAVFVAKTNRIYLFGGYDSMSGTISDRIGYINL